jgi:hypothetical protein
VWIRNGNSKKNGLIDPAAQSNGARHQVNQDLLIGKASAAELPAGAGVGLGVALKRDRLLFRRYADPGVDHCYAQRTNVGVALQQADANGNRPFVVN